MFKTLNKRELCYNSQFTRPLAIPSDVSVTLLKLSFTFVSHFIAEEGYSILTETSTQSFLVSDNTFFISYYYHA